MNLTISDAMQKGIHCHNIGKLQEAEKYYSLILKADPKHPDANYNMGKLAIMFNKNSLAFSFFKIALEVNPRVSQFWYNCINTLIMMKRYVDAKNFFDEARNLGITQDNTFYNLENKLFNTHKFNDLNFKKNLVAKKLSNKEINFIENLLIQKQFSVVLNHVEQMLLEYDCNEILFCFLGRANQGLKNWEYAIKNFKEALNLNPNNENTLFHFSNSQREAGYIEESIKNLKKIIKMNPLSSNALNNIANNYKSLGNFKKALTNYKRAIKIDPNNELSHLNLGIIFYENGEYESAIKCFKEGVRINPIYKNKIHLSDLYLKSNDTKNALILLDNILSEKPFDSRAIAYKTIALRGLKNFKEVEKIINFSEFVNIDNIQNYIDDDFTIFNKSLCSILENHPDRAEEKNLNSWAIRGGSAVRNLLNSKSPILKKFHEIILKVIDNKIKYLQQTNVTPYMKRKPLHYKLDCWANLLKGGDYQENHIHNNGWISGVYYVDLPDDQLNNRDKAGWIEFNRSGYGLPHFGKNKGVKVIQPEIGMFILFPSYIWHGTIPYVGNKNRISISFDVIID